VFIKSLKIQQGSLLCPTANYPSTSWWPRI